MSDTRRGLWFAASAQVLWGLFPLFWPLLEPAHPLELLGHRMVWSALTMGIVVLLLRKTPQLVAVVRNPRQRGWLITAGLLITVNWGGYIWAVMNDHVVEASLGYFINPLISVLLGIVVLHEQLRRWQWAAVGIACVAVVVLTLDLGRPPWIALLLACSFGLYGLCKKFADAGAIESVTFETAVIAPAALVMLLWLGYARGESTFATEGPGHILLMASSGIVTAVPLLLFGAAATRVSLVTLGLVQYIGPIIQFGIGVGIEHEHMSPARWGGFALVWLALVVFTLDAVRTNRVASQAVAEPV